MNTKHIFVVVLSTIIFFSCETGLDSIKSEGSVYLPMSGTADLIPLLGESTYQLGVYRAGINQSEPDVTVNIKVDRDAFNEYLASNPGYELLPETYYSLPVTTVNLPNGQAQEYYPISLHGIDEQFTGKAYILPLSIESVSPASVKISDEKRTTFLRLARYRNVYECSYKAFGQVVAEGDESANKRIDKVLPSTTSTAIDQILVEFEDIDVKVKNVNMKLLLTVQSDGTVTVSEASGSNNYNIKSIEGKQSVYTGVFDETLQHNRGVFHLYYTYTLNGESTSVDVELKSWQ